MEQSPPAFVAPRQFFPTKVYRTLREWRESVGIPQWRFAASIQMRQGRVSNFETGRAYPTAAEALRIEEATNGAVPVEVWK